MDTAIAILRVIHVITAILMAWPFYALVAVNQRVRLGPPLGDRVDTYMENIVKNRAVPCFVFQGTVMISGLALIYLRFDSFQPLVDNALLGLKFLLLLLVAGNLSYVHFSIQPKLDELFASSGDSIGDETAQRIRGLRATRKQFALVCIFLVLTVAMLGVQVYAHFPLALTAILIVMLALFTYKSYRTQMPYGWI
jgi:hypothetical protein